MLARQLARLAAIVILAGIALLLARVFVEVTLAAIVAGILYYLSLPIVSWLGRRRLPRVAAILIVFVALLAVTVLLLVYIIPVVVEQLTILASDIPSVFDRLEQWLDVLERRFGTRVSERQIEDLGDRASSTVSRFVETAVTAILGTLANFFTLLIVAVAGVVAAFYLLKDRDKIAEYVWVFVPGEAHARARRLAEGTNEVLSGFLRGQIIVAVIVGTLAGVAMFIIGIPYAFILGVVAAVLEIIPYLGPILATIPAALLALTVSPVDAILVVAAFFVIQQIETLVLSPRIVGAHVHLHPATVIFSVLMGKQILGLLGVFVAIPVAGIAKVLVKELLSPEQGRETRGDSSR